MPCALQAQGISYRVGLGTTSGRGFQVRAEFPVPAGRDTFLVSLPAWTPGSYEIMNYARYVHGFAAATTAGQPLFWDKFDKDTWRIVTGGARRVVVEFQTDPDSVALELSRIGPDFAFFNGANLFPYPEGAGFDFPADVVLDLPPGWRVATGLPAAAEPGHYHASSYHDLVDSPVFAGRFAFDSVVVDGRPVRFAIYPDSALTPAVWDSVADALRRIAAAEDRIMGGPVDSGYTVLVYAPDRLDWAGGLEHRNSQFDAIALGFFATDARRGVLGPFTRPLLAHEFFHLWNVKRIRPAELWPYDYAHEQYTPLLWWSEGVTDYYADVALTRGGLWSVDRFIASANDNIEQVEGAAEIVSAEDAGIDTWISPTWVDEAQYYYPKGALLGLMLDIEIRRATANRHSLDDVMRWLLDDSWRRGRGFTTRDLLGAIRPWYPEVDDFYRRYIRGREPLPYASVLPAAAIAVDSRESRTPFVGVGTEEGENGEVRVATVIPGSLADSAGIRPGDVLVRLGDVAVSGDAWPALFGARYRTAIGQPIRVVYRRGAKVLTGSGVVGVRVTRRIALRRDPAAPPAAQAILAGITSGDAH
jgi:predicted metalloprotease with PDZ domain